MKTILFLFFVSLWFPPHVFAQTTTIKVGGTVTDAKGMPILGVNVIEKGTNNGVVTDFDGNYEITVPKGATLIFSYLGFATVEEVVDDQSNLDISMTAELNWSMRSIVFMTLAGG